MKKILLTMCLMGAIGFLFAQSVKLGIKGGINFSSLSASSGGLTITSSSSTGFHLGAVAEIGLGDFAIQPGILYSTKGGTYGTASSGGTFEFKFNYIEVPVNLLYTMPAGIGRVFVGGGPYLGYGISGTATATSSGKTQSQDITYGSGTNDTKNPEFGLNVLGGFRFKSGLTLSAGYGFGLSNLNNDNSGTLKNNVTSISVGFFFQ